MMTSMPSKETDFAVFARAGSAPFDGEGVAGAEDVVLGEADFFEEAEHAGGEGEESFVSVEGRGADGVVAGGVGGVGSDPAGGVHGTERGKVFGYGGG